MDSIKKNDIFQLCNNIDAKFTKIYKRGESTIESIIDCHKNKSILENSLKFIAGNEANILKNVFDVLLASDIQTKVQCTNQKKNYVRLLAKYDETIFQSIESDLENLSDFADVIKKLHLSFLKIKEFNVPGDFKLKIKESYDFISSFLLTHSHVSFEENEVFLPKIKIFTEDLSGKTVDIDDLICKVAESTDKKISVLPPYFFSLEFNFGITFDVKCEENQPQLTSQNASKDLPPSDIVCLYAHSLEHFFDKNETFLQQYYTEIISNSFIWDIKELSPMLYLLGVIGLMKKNEIISFENDFNFFNNLFIDQIKSNNFFFSSPLFQWFSKLLYSPLNYLLSFEKRYLIYSFTFDSRRNFQNFQEYKKELLKNNNLSVNQPFILLMNNISQAKLRTKITVKRGEEYNEYEKLYNQAVERIAVQSFDSTLISFQGYVEFDFEEEVGKGTGPTLEFYTNLFHQIQSKNIWIVTSSNYLYPLPKNFSDSDFKCFEVLGSLIGRCILDNRLIDFPLSEIFIDKAFNNHIKKDALKAIDEKIFEIISDFEKLVEEKKKYLDNKGDPSKVKEAILYKGTKIEELGITFVLPGYDDIELIENGKEKILSTDNLEEYIESIKEKLFYSDIINKLSSSFVKGFNYIIRKDSFKAFTPLEIQENILTSKFIGWDEKTLLENIIPDHGYNKASAPYLYLIKYLQTLRKEGQSRFLKFVTGSPRLPFGGFSRLQPKLTVVKRVTEKKDSNPDCYLPSVMTCQNYLKLPDYSSYDTLVKNLEIAVNEGGSQFYLS